MQIKLLGQPLVVLYYNASRINNMTYLKLLLACTVASHADGRGSNPDRTQVGPSYHGVNGVQGLPWEYTGGHTRN